MQPLSTEIAQLSLYKAAMPLMTRNSFNNEDN